ncbi:MAG: hypothetical protein ACQERB_05785 [Promethearchaeati archaeon]
MMEKMDDQKSVQKEEIILTDEQRTQVYSYARDVRNKTLEEVCPALFDVVLDSAEGRLKNDLGKVIFHLQKNERLNTRIGLEKLLDAGLKVNPEKTFRILESVGGEAKELADKIREVL